jgi:hypothetical protein
MSHILRGRPGVAAIHRMLPATQSTLIHDSGQSESVVRETIKLLLASKLAYVSAWKHLDPIVAPGYGVNVPRPSKDEVIAAYASTARKRDRRAYQQEYRMKTAAARAQYSREHREKINANANTRRALVRQLAAGKLTVQDPPIQTVWRTAL